MADAATRDAASQLELAVKASYLTKFGPFVEWPATATPGEDTPLRLCVVGEDPFGPLLDDAARDQRVNGRAIALHRLRAVDRERAAECQILFIGGGADQPAHEALQALAGLPVLTVSDPARGARGGMIQFVLQGGRVRFEVDQALAGQSGLKISAKLLALAVRVKRQ